MSSSNSGTRLRRWRRTCTQFYSSRPRRKSYSSRRPRWGCLQGGGPRGPGGKRGQGGKRGPGGKRAAAASAHRAPPKAGVGPTSALLQLPSHILPDGAVVAAIRVLSPQINTAKRLLEKGKEAPNHEPERSWFQTKEERKKEKSMLERSLTTLTTEL